MFTLLKWMYLLTHNKKQMGPKSLIYVLPYLEAETSWYHFFSFYTALLGTLIQLIIFNVMHTS